MKVKIKSVQGNVINNELQITNNKLLEQLFDKLPESPKGKFTSEVYETLYQELNALKQQKLDKEQQDKGIMEVIEKHRSWFTDIGIPIAVELLTKFVLLP